MLIETDEEITDSGDLKEAINHAEDKKIAGLMYAMGLYKDKPLTWFTAGDFEHHATYNSSGKIFNRDNINNSFSRLEAANVVVHATRDKDSGRATGYRLVEFREYFDHELQK